MLHQALLKGLDGNKQLGTNIEIFGKRISDDKGFSAYLNMLIAFVIVYLMQ